MSLKKQISILFFIEILIFVFFLFKAFILNNSGDLELQGDAIGIMEKDNDIFYLPKKNFEKKEAVLRIYYGDLEAGTYLGTVNYEINKNRSINEDFPSEKSEHELSFSCSEPEYLKANTIILDSRQNYASFYVTITNPVSKFSITVENKGNDDFQINLQFFRSYKGIVRNIFITLSLFTCLESALIIFSKKPKFKKPVFLILVISLISFLPYMLTGINFGHDCPFHFLRIEAIASALEIGQIPVYIQPLWLGNYGNPVSIYYGDVLLYFPAILRFLGFSFNTAYKLFVLFINILTTIIAYISFKSIFKNKKTAWLLTFIYVCAPYRFIDIYLRFAIGEFCGMIFLPLICAGFQGILTSQSVNKKGFFFTFDKYSIFLASGVSGLIATHVITTEMTIFYLIIISFISIKKLLSKYCLSALFKAVIQCLLTSMFFIIPFVDSYISNESQIKYNMAHEIPAIQNHGIQPGELFMFFKDIFGEGRSLYYGDPDRMYLTIGLTLITVLILSFIVLFEKRASRQLQFYTGMTCFSLLLSSNIFPWNFLAYYTHIGKLMSQIQFPWRHLSFATLFAVLTLGELISILDREKGPIYLFNEHNHIRKNQILQVFSLLILIESLFLYSNYSSNRETKVLYNTNDLDTGTIAHTEYIPALTNTELLYNGKIETDNVFVNDINRKGMKWFFTAETKENGGRITIPALFYKGYRAYDKSGQQFDLSAGFNNQISFNLPSDFSGNITVEFNPPWYWQVSQIISFMSIIYMIIELKKNSNKNHSPKP